MRPLAWALAVFALAVLALGWLLDSAPVRERVRLLLVERLAAALGREVRIADVEFDLLPLTVVARGVEIRAVADGDPPLASVRRVSVAADLFALAEGIVALRQIRVEQPEIFLEFREDGSSNLPKLRRGQGDGSRFAFEIAALRIEEGSLQLDQQRIPLELNALGVQGWLSGRGAADLGAEVSARELEILLPKTEPYRGSVSLRTRLKKGELELVKGSFSGPDLEAELDGSFRWGERKKLVLVGTARAGGTLLDRLGYLQGQVRGRFEFDGGIEWEEGVWGFRGVLISDVATLTDRTVSELRGLVSGDRNGVRLDLQQATYAEGAVSGLLAVDLSRSERPVQLDLTFDRLVLQKLLVDQGIPIEGLAGRATGVFNYRFLASSPRQGNGWAEIGITSAQIPRGPVAITGTVPLVIEGGVVRSRALRLTSEAQRVMASGFYDLEGQLGRFDYQISSGRIEELVQLMPGLESSEGPPLWLPTAGNGTLEGVLLLGSQGPATEALLDLYEVEAPGIRAARARGMVLVTGSGVEKLRVDLARPGAALIVAGSIPFERPEEPPAPVELTVDASAWPLAEARPWLPFELPVEGPVSGALRLGGTLENLTGRLAAEVEPARALGLEVARATVELWFDPERVAIEAVRLVDEAGEAVISGSIDLETERLDLGLESSGFDLTRPPFSDFLAGGLQGSLVAGGRLGGTIERPELSARLETRGLTLGERSLGADGRTSTAVNWSGDRLSLDGSLLGLVDFAGGGRFDREGYELDFELQAGDLWSLAQLASETELPEFSGGFGGRLIMVGEFAAETAEVSMELARFELAYHDHALRNLEPVQLRLEEGGLRIDSFYIAEAGTESELFVAGRIGLGEGTAGLDLRLQSTMSAEWAELILPQVSLDGTFDLLATVRGTPEEPSINGQGEMRDGRLLFAGFPQSFDRLTGTVLFYPEQVVVDSLRADFAGGSVRAGGSLKLFGVPEGSQEYRLQFSGQGLSLRYPEGWLIRGDTELQLVSSPDGRSLRGAVTLERAFYLQEVKLGLTQLLQRLFERERLEVEETDELLASTQLNLLIEGPNALRVRNNLADLTGSLDLTVRGSLARPILFGEVEVDPGGHLIYAGNEYEIERGILTFANPYQIEPLLDLVATTETGEFDVTLNLSGTLDRLNATFVSDPPLADLEILALVATGRQPVAGATGATGEVAPSDVGAAGFLYGQAADLVAKRVNTLFGLDKFRIDPLTGSSGNLSSARVTIGKRLSRDLFATYSYDPSETEQQILQLEWQVSPGFALIVTQNGDDTYAVDGRWEQRF